jgi:hypothetical protein
MLGTIRSSVEGSAVGEVDEYEIAVGTYEMTIEG